MANNFDSNITQKLMKKFIPAFQNKRVLTANVNTQLFQGNFQPDTGDTISVKRPTDFVTTRTADGDVSGGTAQSIFTGKASATVQPFFTVETDWTIAEQALEMDQLDEIVTMPAVNRIVTDFEVDFAAYMVKNTGLLAGTYGTAVSTWDHVAEASSVLKSTGVPVDASNTFYAANSYIQSALASNQRSLGAGGEAGKLIADSVRTATIQENFASMRVMSCDALATVTLPTTGDLVGAVNGAPTATYLAAKDTMTQTVAVDGFGTFTGTIPAGAVVEVTGPTRLNLATRKPIVNGSGAAVAYTGVVTADASFTSGAGTLIISGPAIYEASGAFNTVSAAIADNDVITIKGADAATYQPNLFWHRDAFTVASVPIPKLYSTDTIAQTPDGLQVRISKGASIRENKQIVRFDFWPAYGTLNPFMSGQGFGSA